jgi:transposase
MIRGGFLSPAQRSELLGLLRDGCTEQRVARRANAMLLLDDGWSCEKVAKALYLDDDTVRGWRKTYVADGLEGLRRFEGGGSASYLSAEQEARLQAWIAETLPRSTNVIGAYVAKAFGVVYESRSGLIAMLHRLGLEYVKPETIGRKLDPEKQKAFIEAYENLLNSLGPDEAALFLDAVHPTHAARPVGCWAPAKDNPAIEQTSGRQRLNVHGAIDLETGKTAMIDVETVDAASTIRLLQAIEAMYPLLAVIHVFLDNARYHHAQIVREWLAQPGRRIRLHFIPAYCPHLNPIERLWGVMHKHLTHNICYASYRDFAEAVLDFLREHVPRRWPEFRDSVTDNFRVINPKDFRLVT